MDNRVKTVLHFWATGIFYTCITLILVTEIGLCFAGVTPQELIYELLRGF
jgi:hypothetical protein